MTIMKSCKLVVPLFLIVLLCALLSGCAEKITLAEEYGHLQERYVIYDIFIYIVEGGEEPSQEFVQAREALIMARYDEAYAGFEALAGAADNDLERARCLNGMAVTQAIQSRYAACNELFEQALAIYGDLGEESRIEMALCMQNKAIMLYEQTLYDDTIAIMEVVQEMQKKLPYAHPDRAVGNLIYGEVIIRENYAEAISEIYGAHAKMEEVFGPDNLFTLTCQGANHWAAWAHMRVGSFDWEMEKAAAFYAVQIEALKEAYGEEHPLIGMVYLDMGQMHIKHGEYDTEALEYLEKAEAILMPVYGENHMKMFDSYTARAFYHERLGEYDLSMEYNVKSINQLTTIQMYGYKDEYYAYCLGDIANIYVYTGEPEKSVDYILRQSYIFKTYWDKEPTPNTMELLERYYNEYNLSDQPFEVWYDEQMAYHAAHEDEPMIVEGYEYLYK